jgi:hypothetical protein
MASSGHLKAGEQGTITARVSTLLKEGMTIETIEVVSNDPKRPKVVLTLQARVLKKILP